jgi:hypothetical protein
LTALQARLKDRWPKLPEDIKSAIEEMVHGAATTTTEQPA